MLFKYCEYYYLSIVNDVIQVLWIVLLKYCEKCDPRYQYAYHLWIADRGLHFKKHKIVHGAIDLLWRIGIIWKQTVQTKRHQTRFSYCTFEKKGIMLLTWGEKFVCVCVCVCVYVCLSVCRLLRSWHLWFMARLSNLVLRDGNTLCKNSTMQL